jgi:nicotinic acid phosphoribosyltransferase
MGEPLTIVVEYRSDRKLSKPGVGIGINHPQAGRVLSLGTRVAEYQNAPDYSAGGIFICELDQVPLNQGTYTFVVVLSEGLVDLERIENACKLQIVPNDVFGTGSIITANQGVVFKNHSWRFEERN